MPTVNPEQRQRASLAVRARMNHLQLTVPELARRAGVDPDTVQTLLSGKRWPRATTRNQICQALDWPLGEIARRAVARPELSEFTLSELADEVCRRIKAQEREAASGNAF